MAKRTYKEKMARKKSMTREEVEAWNQCYEYFKHNLLGYDKNQKIPTSTILRLKGMLTGKFMENSDVKSLSNYSYEVLLNTMKFCKPDVQRALGRNTFKDESHKVNYILKIIDNNINTVYMRMQNKEKQNERMKTVDVSQSVHEGAAYQKKTEDIADKFNDLW